MAQDTIAVLKHVGDLCNIYMLGRTACIKNEEVLADCVN